MDDQFDKPDGAEYIPEDSVNTHEGIASLNLSSE
jgi:hypothetical protein